MTLTNFTTEALDSLCTQEQLELLDSIDTLRSQGISHYVSLPQIIVCGDQSSGKSSVLEAISGVSFPVKSSLCTRFPTELVLRKNSQVGIRVSIVPHQSRSEAEQSSLGSFCEQLDGFDGLANLIENAKAAMGISTHGKAFSNDLLRVEVSGPDRPHLTIVDLPGLIHSETRQQSAADVKLVQDVVQSYMKEPRSVILAVVSAKNDFANQIVLRLARDADPSGNRTLGVISKPDMLVPGSESEASFVSLAKNQDVEFRLGWHVLKNMDSEKGQWGLSDRNIHELNFFSQGIWQDLPRSLVGVDSLRARLSRLLLGQIAGELPSLIDEINSKMISCREQLKKLGDPRVTLEEQKLYLLHISQAFQSLVKTAVDGTYNEPFFGDAKTDNGYQKRIRAVIQNLNEQFTEKIFQRGHFRHILEAEDDSPVSKQQIRLTRDEYILHIEWLLRKTRGRELSGTFNPMIVKDLFQEQCVLWEDMTRSHIDSIWMAAKDFLQYAAYYVADEATSKALLKEVVIPALERLRQVLDKGSEDLLKPHRRGHPITYNHYFTETLQKTRTSRQQEAFRESLKSHFDVDTLSAEPQIHSINLQELFNSLLRTTIPDMTRFASEEALDCMLAYYKVCKEYRIDQVFYLTREISKIGCPQAFR
jgi:GTPase SAR1 family protein